MSRIKKIYPSFSHWQERGNIIIFSDSHWDDNDREFMGYGISESDQCKSYLKNIRSGDTVICLGDVGNPMWMDYIRHRRNHIKTVLIKGNHDVGNTVYEPYFDEIYEGAVFIAPQILLSHEPIISDWYFNVHGHDHDAKGIYDLWDKWQIVGINLAGNVANFTTLNLNDFVNNGGLKEVPTTIHRKTIDKAIVGKYYENRN